MSQIAPKFLTDLLSETVEENDTEFRPTLMSKPGYSKVLDFLASPLWTVFKLKSMINDYEIGYGNADKLRLYCHGKLLDDDKTLAYYGITTSKSVIMVQFRVIGGGGYQGSWRCNSTTVGQPGYFLWTIPNEKEKFDGFECTNNGKEIKILNKGDYEVKIKIGWGSCGTPDALFALKLNNQDIKTLHRQKDVSSFYGEFNEKVQCNANDVISVYYTCHHLPKIEENCFEIKQV